MDNKANDPWVQKDVWLRRGGKFNVEVTRHTVPASPLDPYEGTNRWCVYAYIFNDHRLFERFEGTDMFQDAASSLPLHCGPSYLKAHRNEKGEIVVYQVGADYHHLYDERFSHYTSKNDAYEVFSDADRLFEHLSELPLAKRERTE